MKNQGSQEGQILSEAEIAQYLIEHGDFFFYLLGETLSLSRPEVRYWLHWLRQEGQEEKILNLRLDVLETLNCCLAELAKLRSALVKKDRGLLSSLIQINGDLKQELQVLIEKTQVVVANWKKNNEKAALLTQSCQTEDGVIVVTPEFGLADVSGSSNQGSGFAMLQGRRSRQEDALFQAVLPKDFNLTPEEIGLRLWTEYRHLDAELDPHAVYHMGSTASTCVDDGNEHLVLATAGDAASFVAVYVLLETGEIALSHVLRLNDIVHKPILNAERERIQAEGGWVEWIEGDWRVNAYLNISRSIGDKHLAPYVCPEPRINIMSFDAIAKAAQCPRGKIAKLQLITTSDGYTDGAREGIGSEWVKLRFKKVEEIDGNALERQAKIGQEEFLFKSLLHIFAIKRAFLTEEEIAIELAKRAIECASYDNVTVAVHTIDLTKERQASMQGVYDGHGGSKVSTELAQKMFHLFLELAQMKEDEYAAMPYSVFESAESQALFQRDNPDFGLIFKPRARPQLSPEDEEVLFQKIKEDAKQMTSGLLLGHLTYPCFRLINLIIRQGENLQWASETELRSKSQKDRDSIATIFKKLQEKHPDFKLYCEWSKKKTLVEFKEEVTEGCEYSLS